MTIRLALEDWERDLLRGLPQTLLALMAERPDDPVLQRLSPPAYSAPAHGDYEAEYQSLMGSDLAERHRAALQTLMDTADAESLSPEQAEAWLIALNQVRLVLGTKLDVSEDDDDGPSDPSDPRAMEYEVYSYLGGLQDSIVRQLWR